MRLFILTAGTEIALNSLMVTYYKLSKAQKDLVVKAFRKEGACFIRGAEVRVARKLVQLGLATLEDNGNVAPNGVVDDERWWLALTPSGCGVGGNLVR